MNRLERVFIELSEQYYAKLVKSIKTKRVGTVTPPNLTNQIL